MLLWQISVEEIGEDCVTSDVDFKPTDSCRWYFDKTYDCLMLEIENDMLFRSRYTSHILVPDALTTFPFSIDDVAAYSLFYERSNQLNLTDSQRIELSLNAVIAANYLKPQMPKSWYFIENISSTYQPELADVVETCKGDTEEIVNMLVVEPGDNASVCVIAEPVVQLKNKLFYLADVIKVMNDRLSLKKFSI